MGLGSGLSLWGSTVGHPLQQLGFLLPFWYRLTWVVPDKIQKSYKMIVCVFECAFICWMVSFIALCLLSA